MKRVFVSSTLLLSLAVTGTAQASNQRAPGPSSPRHSAISSTVNSQAGATPIMAKPQQPTVLRGAQHSGPRRGNPGVEINSQPVPPGKGGWDVSRSQTK
jgi:hypothetical protein